VRTIHGEIPLQEAFHQFPFAFGVPDPMTARTDRNVPVEIGRYRRIRRPMISSRSWASFARNGSTDRSRKGLPAPPRPWMVRGSWPKRVLISGMPRNWRASN
jgi:hypothetical protein